MLKKFTVKNFKNFKNTLCIDFTKVHDYKFNDFCVKDGLISKMIVYGKNAEGKTNLGRALCDLQKSIFFVAPHFADMYRGRQYKNADAAEDELVEFFYSFRFGDDTVDYEYRKKDENDTVYEKFSVNGRVLFFYDKQSGESDFGNVDEINAGDLNWEEFIEGSETEEEGIKPTALRYIIFNTVQNADSVIYKLSQFIRGMRFSNSVDPSRVSFLYSETDENTEELRKFEKFLNDYGVNCKLVLIKQPDGSREIFFDYARPLRFSGNLSSGTAALSRFYAQYLANKKPSFVYMDEFDAYYHYELSEKIVELLEKEFDCQVILTTHNTDLLSNSIMRPDCFWVLGSGVITPICELTNRELRQGHNLEKLYRNGEFNV